MIVAGIGCRSSVDASQIDAAIDGALENTLQAETLGLIAAPAAKAKEAGIVAAAQARGVELLWISQQELEAANPRTLTRSRYAMVAMNVHSVAEAAALAGAGAGSRLLAPRIVIGPVTCALAMTQDRSNRGSRFP